MKNVLSVVKDIATIVLPLAGVLVGAQLARRSANEQWLKKERLEAYLKLLQHLREMTRRFGVGLRVSKFRAEAAEHGHDFEGVSWGWQEDMEELEHIEVSIRLLGGRLGALYEATADDLISEMLDAIDDDEISEPEWDHLLGRAHQLIQTLESTAAADLHVPCTHKTLIPGGSRRRNAVAAVSASSIVR